MFTFSLFYIGVKIRTLRVIFSDSFEDKEIKLNTRMDLVKNPEKNAIYVYIFFILKR